MLSQEKASTSVMDAGPKTMQPVIPAIPSEKGNTGEGPPIREPGAASSTTTGPINQMSEPNIRASRDAPAQVPLMSMMGGPINMSFMNMYEDDMLNLVYRNFDLQSFSVQTGQVRGAVIARFPYGLNLLNPYAQTWARLHKRYNGRIRLTFSVSAVPLLKGNVIVGVVRNMPPTKQETINIASLQKINWAVINLNGSGDYMFEVGDARQTKFFRNVSEDPPQGEPADVADRPGIIMAIYTPIANQFGPDSDSSVIFNIRSQAISPAEDPITGFYCYEPIDQAITSIESRRSVNTGITPLNSIFVDKPNLSMMVDGTKGHAYDLYSPPTANRGSSFTVMPSPSNAIITDKVTLYNWPTVNDHYDWDGDRCYLFGRTNLPSNELKFNTFKFMGTNLTREKMQVPRNFVDFIADGADYLGYTQKNVAGSSYDAGFKIWYITLGNESVVVDAQPTFSIRHLYNFGWFEIHVVKLSTISPTGPISPVPIWSDNTPITIDSAFPSAEGTLPLGFANFKIADPSDVIMQGSPAGLPVYNPSYDFPYALETFFISAGVIGNGLRVVDMLDIRTGSYIGTIGLFGDGEKQFVVIRTDSSASSHFRITTDVQYVGLSSPRMDSNLPPINPKNLLNVEPSIATQLSALQERFFSMNHINPIHNPFKQAEAQPNALLAGAMVGGGLLSGLGQGLSAVGQHQSNITLAKLQQQFTMQNQAALFAQQAKLQGLTHQQQIALQQNLFGHETAMQSGLFDQQHTMLAHQFLNTYNLNSQKFGFDTQLKNQDLQNRLLERGLSAFSKVPGNMARQTATTSSRRSSYSEPSQLEVESPPTRPAIKEGAPAIPMMYYKPINYEPSTSFA